MNLKRRPSEPSWPERAAHLMVPVEPRRRRPSSSRMLAGAVITINSIVLVVLAAADVPPLPLVVLAGAVPLLVGWAVNRRGES